MSVVIVGFLFFVVGQCFSVSVGNVPKVDFVFCTKDVNVSSLFTLNIDRGDLDDTSAVDVSFNMSESGFWKLKSELPKHVVLKTNSSISFVMEWTLFREPMLTVSNSTVFLHFPEVSAFVHHKKKDLRRTVVSKDGVNVALNVVEGSTTIHARYGGVALLCCLFFFVLHESCVEGRLDVLHEKLVEQKDAEDKRDVEEKTKAGGDVKVISFKGKGKIKRFTKRE